MKFPFISILPLVDEVKDELKILTKTSSFTEEEIYGWMIEASRLIGSASYEADSAYLTVKRHATQLPAGFYLLDNIELCGVASDSTLTVPRYIHTKVLVPADNATRNLCTNKITVQSDRSLNYILKVPPGIGRFSFADGVVHIDFQKLSTDEEGNVLVMDEPNALKALKGYSKLMLVGERYILQQIPRYIYQDLKTEWEDHRDTAQRILKYPSQADNNYLALKQEARFRKFRYRNQ